MIALIMALLALQQGEIDRLVGELASDHIEVRERAGDRLLEIGTPAQAALEKLLKSSDAEVVARARSLLGEIETAADRSKVLGPVYRITVEAGEHTLGRIAERVKEQTGVELRIEDERREDLVRIEGKRMLLWDFLDRLCRAHGSIHLPLRQPPDAIALSNGKPTGAPVHNSGAFRVSIERIRTERRDPFDTNWEGAALFLAVTWQPNVRPLNEFLAKPDVRVTRIETQDGKGLRVDEHYAPFYTSGDLADNLPRTHRAFVTFEHPPRGTRKLRRIEGTAEVLLPLKYENVTIKKPLESIGEKQTVGRYAITLKSCTKDDAGTRVWLRLSGPRSKVELRVRFDDESVVLRGTGGSEARGRPGASSYSSGEGESLDQEVTFAAGVPMDELRLRFMSELFERRVEFHFQDVEVP